MGLLVRFSVGLGQTLSDLALRSDTDTDAGGAEDEVEDEQDPYKSEWEDTCRWRLDLLNYDLGDDEDMDLDGVEMGPVELKPNSLEACLRMIMLEMDTEDPVGEYGHLLAIERYPDMEDAGRKYPLMPADFNIEDNVMNKEYEVFERRFRDACQFFVCEITGKSPDSPTAPAQAPLTKVPLTKELNIKMQMQMSQSVAMSVSGGPAIGYQNSNSNPNYGSPSNPSAYVNSPSNPTTNNPSFCNSPGNQQTFIHSPGYVNSPGQGVPPNFVNSPGQPNNQATSSSQNQSNNDLNFDFLEGDADLFGSLDSSAGFNLQDILQ
ncbi:hypothetical protein FOCC_FOCC004181 [Frankliniella occidentalis]|nr:hypothetical protein FOCC_FOCC004181 [Frankliniella occidentalis]